MVKNKNSLKKSLNIHIFNRLCGVMLLFLWSAPSIAQIHFQGAPETLAGPNSRRGEQYLSLSRDGNVLFFTGEKYPENKGGMRDGGDVWTSRYDSVWQKPEQMPFNDAHFASPLGWTADERYFLYNKVWFEKGLYYGGVFAWDKQRPRKEIAVDIPFFKNKSPLQTGSLSADGRYLLLSLENNQSYGVDDLYVCILQPDGKWGAPLNLGYQVNSAYQEITPFLASDNRTLFFASNGHRGEGSFDLFISFRLDDTWQRWTEPENLGPSINTSGAETSLVFQPGASHAFYTSTLNSDGYADIKRIPIRAGFVQEPDTVVLFMPEDPLDEDRRLVYRLTDAQTGELVMGEVLFADGKSKQARGVVQLELTFELSWVEFKAENYLSVEREVVADQPGDTITIAMEPLRTGNVITLKNVLFYRATANFVEGSERELNMVAEMLTDHPEISIFLKGHTDNTGNPAMNQQLSDERVLAVREYLIQKGIAAERISGMGYGGTEPVASNESEETRRLNRRVEFEIRR